MKLVGVTGGVCSGKTTISALFGALGAKVINADAIVHKLYASDRSVQRAVVKRFGADVLTRGKIDRTKLKTVAFREKKNLRALSAIVHPKVIRHVEREIRRSKRRVIVVDAPLLIEAGL